MENTKDEFIRALANVSYYVDALRTLLEHAQRDHFEEHNAAGVLMAGSNTEDVFNSGSHSWVYDHYDSVVASVHAAELLAQSAVAMLDELYKVAKEPLKEVFA